MRSLHRKGNFTSENLFSGERVLVVTLDDKVRPFRTPKERHKINIIRPRLVSYKFYDKTRERQIRHVKIHKHSPVCFKTLTRDYNVLNYYLVSFIMTHPLLSVNFHLFFSDDLPVLTTPVYTPLFKELLLLNQIQKKKEIVEEQVVYQIQNFLHSVLNRTLPPVSHVIVFNP